MANNSLLPDLKSLLADYFVEIKDASVTNVTQNANGDYQFSVAVTAADKKPVDSAPLSLTRVKSPRDCSGLPGDKKTCGGPVPATIGDPVDTGVLGDFPGLSVDHAFALGGKIAKAAHQTLTGSCPGDDPKKTCGGAVSGLIADEFAQPLSKAVAEATQGADGLDEKMATPLIKDIALLLLDKTNGAKLTSPA